MILALAVFVRFYCITHPAASKRGLLHVVPVERAPQ